MKIYQDDRISPITIFFSNVKKKSVENILSVLDLTVKSDSRALGLASNPDPK